MAASGGKKYFKEHCNLHTMFPPGYISLESKKQNAFRRLHCPCQDVSWSPSNAVYLCCKNLFHPWTQGSNSKGTSVAYDRALGSSRHRLYDLNESPVWVKLNVSYIHIQNINPLFVQDLSHLYRKVLLLSHAYDRVSIISALQKAVPPPNLPNSSSQHSMGHGPSLPYSPDFWECLSLGLSPVWPFGLAIFNKR